MKVLRLMYKNLNKMEKVKIPPIGIIPFWLFMKDENPDYKIRKLELKEAIYRYLAENLEVDIEWIIEYNKYVK